MQPGAGRRQNAARVAERRSGRGLRSVPQAKVQGRPRSCRGVKLGQSPYSQGGWQESREGLPESPGDKGGQRLGGKNESGQDRSLG